MAKLRSALFVKGAELVFNIFEEAVKTGTYYREIENRLDPVIVEGATPPITSFPIRCIFEQIREKDVSLIGFSDHIQPSDIFGLIPCVDLVLSIKTNGDYIDFGSDGVYFVIGYIIDPMNIICTALLRKN